MEKQNAKQEGREIQEKEVVIESKFTLLNVFGFSLMKEIKCFHKRNLTTLFLLYVDSYIFIFS